MQEISDKKKEKAAEKDYYTRVTVCQIISAGVLFLIYLLIICPSQNAKDEFMTHFNAQLWDTYGLIQSAKSYFTSEGTWQVFGDNVTFAAETEATDENLSGTGGEDIEVYQAADNTSFASIKITSPAIKPVEGGRYTSYFGYRINPITGKFSFHTGLDIAAAEGTKVRAAFSGRVAKVGEDDRAGKYIILSHDDGFVTFYCHCSEIVAQEGAVIRQGETIAAVGSTGWSTGPHLHFEIRKNNIRYNPIFILCNDS